MTQKIRTTPLKLPSGVRRFRFVAMLVSGCALLSQAIAERPIVPVGERRAVRLLSPEFDVAGESAAEKAANRDFVAVQSVSRARDTAAPLIRPGAVRDDATMTSVSQVQASPASYPTQPALQPSSYPGAAGTTGQTRTSLYRALGGQEPIDDTLQRTRSPQHRDGSQFPRGLFVDAAGNRGSTRSAPIPAYRLSGPSSDGAEPCNDDAAACSTDSRSSSDARRRPVALFFDPSPAGCADAIAGCTDPPVIAAPIIQPKRKPLCADWLRRGKSSNSACAEPCGDNCGILIPRASVNATWGPATPATSGCGEAQNSCTAPVSYGGCGECGAYGECGVITADACGVGQFSANAGAFGHSMVYAPIGGGSVGSQMMAGTRYSSWSAPNSPRRVSGAGPANQDGDVLHWLTPYHQRSGNVPGAELLPTGGHLVALPPGFAPWWDPLLREPLGLAQGGLPVTVDQLVLNALEYAPQVQVLKADPQIRRTALAEEYAQFDWKSFLETTYDNISDPVGSQLITGNNSNRFEDRINNGAAGLKRRTSVGGQLEVAQRIGHQYNNSRYLTPNPQSTSRLELSYTQPLLNGRGRTYNQSRIVLASIDLRTSEDDSLDALQKHLLDVTEAYWELYRSRAVLLQRQKVLASAEQILAMLSGREEVDAAGRQILRARSAVASRRSEIVRAATSIRNAESRLRLLVNDPQLVGSAHLELTPSEMPAPYCIDVSMQDSLNTALANRPDISASIRSMRSTTVRLGVARNEILPKLDLIVSTYAAGLDGGPNIDNSFGNQFSRGRPSYTAGLMFEMPLGNRAARARYERRIWEMNRAINEFRTIVETAMTEVEIAVREQETSWREMLSRYQAMLAAQQEAGYLYDRWTLVPGADGSTTLLLEDLLDAQERLADEESDFVTAQVSYAMSVVRLRQSTGTLLRAQSMSAVEPGTNGDLPIGRPSLPQPSQFPESPDFVSPLPMSPVPDSPIQWTPHSPMPNSQPPSFETNPESSREAPFGPSFGHSRVAPETPPKRAIVPDMGHSMDPVWQSVPSPQFDGNGTVRPVEPVIPTRPGPTRAAPTSPVPTRPPNSNSTTPPAGDESQLSWPSHLLTPTPRGRSAMPSPTGNHSAQPAPLGPMTPRPPATTPEQDVPYPQTRSSVPPLSFRS